MKRKFLKAGKGLAIALAALLLLGAAALGGLYARSQWLRDNKPYTIGTWERNEQSGRDRMFVLLENTVDPDVTGLQTLTTVNRTGEDLEEVVLRVYANGPHALGLGAQAVEIGSVYVDDEPVSFAFDEADTTIVRIDYPWKAGEEIKLRWHISVPLTGDVTLVSLPVLGVYEDGAWRTDAWDPLVQGSHAQAFDVQVHMEYNEDIAALFGAAVTTYEDDPSGRLICTWQSGARDVTMLVRRSGAQRCRVVEDVRVCVAAEGAFEAERLLAQCETALSSLAAAGFAYPHEALTIVKTDTGYEDGFAATAFVAIDEALSGEAQLRALTRLIARQTFGVLVGYDPWNAPWLSQTLSSTAELMAYRARKGEMAFERRFFEEIEVATRLTRPYGVSVGAGIDRFGSETEMAQVLANQGAAMMLGLEEAMGREAFARALTTYAEENALTIADRAALEAALESASGNSWAGYLEDELAF